MSFTSAPTAPAWTEPERYPNILEFPDERVGPEDLQAMAAGLRDAAPLVDLILQGGLGDRPLHAAFVPPKGERVDATRYGWPLQVLLVREDAWYEDVFARQGVTQTRFQWVGGFRDRVWRWRRAVILAGVWFFGRLLREAAVLLRVGKSGGGRLRDRFVERLPLLALAVAVVASTVLSIVMPVRELSMGPHPVTAATSSLGMTRDDLAAMPGPERDPALARAVLGACPPVAPGAEDEGCLAMSWELTRGS